MTSAMESRMLFGESGAENLLMKGDLFYKDIGPAKRYQAIYLTDPQRQTIFQTQNHSAIDYTGGFPPRH